jgi:hypothetical protein
MLVRKQLRSDKCNPNADDDEYNDTANGDHEIHDLSQWIAYLRVVQARQMPILA